MSVSPHQGQSEVKIVGWGIPNITCPSLCHEFIHHNIYLMQTNILLPPYIMHLTAGVLVWLPIKTFQPPNLTTKAINLHLPIDNYSV